MSSSWAENEVASFVTFRQQRAIIKYYYYFQILVFLARVPLADIFFVQPGMYFAFIFINDLLLPD